MKKMNRLIWLVTLTASIGYAKEVLTEEEKIALPSLKINIQVKPPQ